jgi:hypothetical protein
MTRCALATWTRPELVHAVRYAERQRDAVLALHAACHTPGDLSAGLSCASHGPSDSIAARCVHCVGFPYPCPTVRALGVDVPTERTTTP